VSGASGAVSSEGTSEHAAASVVVDVNHCPQRTSAWYVNVSGAASAVAARTTALTPRPPARRAPTATSGWPRAQPPGRPALVLRSGTRDTLARVAFTWLRVSRAVARQLVAGGAWVEVARSCFHGKSTLLNLCAPHSACGGHNGRTSDAHVRRHGVLLDPQSTRPGVGQTDSAESDVSIESGHVHVDSLIASSVCYLGPAGRRTCSDAAASCGCAQDVLQPKLRLCGQR
jgi:hypothetical protein